MWKKKSNLKKICDLRVKKGMEITRLIGYLPRAAKSRSMFFKILSAY